MNEIEKVLRKNTVNLFSDKWYQSTTNELLNISTKQKGYVYFIKNGKDRLVKIGKSGNLNDRLNSFRTSFGNELYLLGYIYTEDFNDFEKEIHNKFSKKRERGEWFDLDENSIESIIKSYDGIVVKGFFNAKSKIIDTVFFGIDINSNSLPTFYNDFCDYCKNNLKENIRYPKQEFYKNVIEVNEDYKTLSPKKINLMLKEWCKISYLKYYEINSCSVRGFLIKKN